MIGDSPKHITKASILPSLRRLMRLTGPIMVAQLAQTANGFVDTVMAGQASALDLAAVSVGSSFWIPVYLLMNGILVAITPVVAQYRGADKLLDAGNTAKQGLWLGLILGLIGFFFLRHCDFVFALIDVEQQLSKLTLGYLHSIAWGFIPVSIFMTLRAFSEGLSITKPMMIISFIGLLCNIPLNWIFIFGKFGAPALGGEGCGIATAIVMALMALMLALYVNQNSSYRSTGFKLSLPSPDWQVLANLLQIGIPIGVTIFVEVSIFAVISLLISSLGAEVVAGHQIALNFASLLFMLPLSVAFAVTITVGQAIGEQNPSALIANLKSGLIFSLGIACFNSLLIFFFRDEIPKLYNENPAVIALASELLIFAIIFQFSDALQVFAQGALRGLKETRTPMIVTLIAYWLIGLPLGITFGIKAWITDPMGPQGFWLGLVVGLSVAALLLNYQLFKIIRGRYLTKTVQ